MMKRLNHKYHRLHFSNTAFAVCLFVSIVAISACDKNPVYDLPKENKLVVLAEITAGDSAFIPVSASRVAGSGNNISFEKVNDASVVVAAQGGAERQLWLNQSPDFADNPASVFTDPGIFVANTNYTINVSHPVLGTATAVTHIPPPFVVSNVSSAESTVLGREVFNFNFSIDDAAGETNYYIFEAVKQLVRITHYFYWQGIRYDYDTQAGQDLHETLEDEEDVDIPVIKDTIATNKYLRLNIFTTDNNTDNKNIGSLDSSFRRVFIRDSLFNGQSFSTTISVVMDQFEAVYPQDKGIVLIRIKSVGKDFYNYMLQYERYKTDFGKMPVGQLTSPIGNIQNGFGIFGGSFKREWKFYYDDLE